MNIPTRNNSSSPKAKDENLRKTIQGSKLVNLKLSQKETAKIAGISQSSVGHNKKQMIDVTLKYRTRPRGGEWEDKEYPVGLEWTPCHYGGHRPWFLCPCCRRRVAILFGGSIYACRHCHNLAYDSQREMVHTRLQSRAHKLRARLGGDCWWHRPKGMHQRTYKKLLAEYQHYEEAADVAFYGRAKKILGR